MSERSQQWHIRVQQAMLLQLLQAYWWENACAVDILAVQEDEQEREQFEQERTEKFLKGRLADEWYLVSPTDSAGWTVVWPEGTADWDERLWQHLSWEAQAPLLAGSYFSTAGTEHWAWFQAGRRQAEHWGFGENKSISGSQLDRNKRPTGEMGLDDAFAVFERTYYHWRNSLAIVSWAGFPPSDYQLILLRCDWHWRFSVPEIQARHR